MRRTLIRSALAALGLAAALTGCSAGLLDKIPESLGGLPADTPPPPRTPYQYPAVHDMPPARATEPLTEDQQLKLEDDLKALRNRQEGRKADENEPEPDDKKAAKAAKPGKQKTKKKPAAAQAGESPGAKTYP